MTTYLTSKQLQQRWGVSRTTVWRMVRDGQLKQTMIRKRPRFHVRDVERAERAAK